MENKHFKANVLQLITGIFMVSFAALMEFAIISGAKGEKDGIILIIAGNVVFIIWIAIYGMIFISTYLTDVRNIKKALSKYGEDRIKAHIASNQQKVYEKAGKSVYFTDKVIVDFTQGVIPYNMIAFAHMTNVTSKYKTLTSITLQTYDDGTYTICEKIKTEEVEEYLLFMHEKNPKMILGYSDQKQQQYNALTEQYKAGKITIEDVEL